MSTLAWIVVAYVLIDRALHVLWVGKSIDITPGSAVLALITGAGIIYAVAGAA